MVRRVWPRREAPGALRFRETAEKGVRPLAPAWFFCWCLRQSAAPGRGSDPFFSSLFRGLRVAANHLGASDLVIAPISAMLRITHGKSIHRSAGNNLAPDSRGRAGAVVSLGVRAQVGHRAR